MTRALSGSVIERAFTLATGLPTGGVTSTWNVAIRNGWNDLATDSVPQLVRSRAPRTEFSLGSKSEAG